MTGELELRRLGYDHPDAAELTERVQRYYVELYGGPDTDPLTAEMVSPPSGGFVIGYLDGVPVAMGGWFRDPDDPAGTAKIRRMYVDPGVRRTGIGRRLLAALESDAARSGVRRMLLATGRPQTGAIALYRRSGYLDVEPFGHYADSDGVVCLGKTLEPALLH
ncbi:GNAT family N-acetyltransferase [Microlunatus ginsengisoli]|uniref:GNAT family N-acetyltransferase n=1 Tax=Microlunatus ginsengisoli TaxID=363863 RepID=A0ABP6ZQZ0_9ACTN